MVVSIQVFLLHKLSLSQKGINRRWTGFLNISSIEAGIILRINITRLTTLVVCIPRMGAWNAKEHEYIKKRVILLVDGRVML